LNLLINSADNIMMSVYEESSDNHSVFFAIY
jgi:hypothetical protein